MDEDVVKRAADYLTENQEQVAFIYRKMHQDINSLTTEELYALKAYIQMNENWTRRLNQAVNTPNKKTKKFWKR